MAILPTPPAGVPFLDPVTGAPSVQWQNFLNSLQTITGGFAPLDARYWVSTSNSDLTNETNLGALMTGYLKLTVAAGVGTPSTVTSIPGTDITGSALTKTDDTNVTLTLGGSPLTGLLRAISITVGWLSQLGLSRGGTHADLSATGGTNQVLKQSSAGADITVGTLAATNLSDVFSQQTFTPALAFGGASTGITYSGQVGRYLQIGKYIWFQISLLLTSKGSATGGATVSLPATAANVTNNFAVVPTIGATFAAGTFTPVSYIQPNTAVIVPTKGDVAGALTQLTDADFTNTTNLILTGCYETT